MLKNFFAIFSRKKVEVEDTYVENDTDEVVMETSPPILAVNDPIVEVHDMFISSEKKRVIQSILSVFETGSVEPDYGAVCVLKDGAGITYGKHQSTDGGDALDLIIMRYIDKEGEYADILSTYLPMLDKNDTSKVDPDNLPSWVKELMNILHDAGSDPIMQACQDAIFDIHYWTPAMSQAMDMKLEYPLSWLICYDSTIHSGPAGVSRIRRRFPESPPSGGGNEKEWVIAYLDARRKWLASNSNPVVQNTVYRIDAMLDMVADDNWNLNTPLSIEKPKAIIV